MDLGDSHVVSLSDLPEPGSDITGPMERAVGQIEEYGRAHRSTYAGVFVSRVSVIVGFVRNASTHATELRQMIPDDVELLVFVADFTLTQLETIADAVRRERVRWKAQGLEISLVAPLIHRNRVLVMGQRLTQSLEDQMEQAYENALVFQDGRLEPA